MTIRWRAGVVGAGNISEFHIAALQAVADVELIGITDLSRERAEARASAAGIKAYDSVAELVAAGANVLHICTPPSSHASLAMEAMALGCHVLVEKPLAEDEGDCKAVAEAARKHQRVATVNHSLLYDPQLARALERVRAGEFGDVVSVDILRGSEYPPFEGGPLPPHYRDAGYPFRDLGVHCFYLLEAFLGPIVKSEGSWLSLGGDPNLAYDEWRAIVQCERGLGQFQLSWNTKPLQSQLIIHGTKGILRVDLFAMFHGARRSTPLPKAAERIVNAFAESIGPMIDVPQGVWNYARKVVRPYQGLREFVADFYARLTNGELPAVSLEDATRVVAHCEAIARAAEAEHRQALAAVPRAAKVDVVVTGAAGALGSAILDRLASDQRVVRAFVRRIPASPRPGVVYEVGNLGDPAAVDRAIAGAAVVIHCGAAMKGGWPEHLGGTVVGTQNVIASCKKHRVEQLVHISSMSVVDWAGSENRTVDETAALEPNPAKRGAYTRAKLEAELAVQAAAQAGLPCVILRPGQIFGGRIPLVNGAVARRAFGKWLVLGDGKLELPLIYIDDVVDAVMLAIAKQLHRGEILQLVDPTALTQADVLALVGGDNGAGPSIMRVPRHVLFAVGRFSELPLGLIGKESPVSKYRLRSALSRMHYESSRARELLGWVPSVGVAEGIRRVAAARGKEGKGSSHA